MFVVLVVVAFYALGGSPITRGLVGGLFIAHVGVEVQQPLRRGAQGSHRTISDRVTARCGPDWVGQAPVDPLGQLQAHEAARGLVRATS